MTTVIKLNDKARIEWNGDSWQPILFKAGGNLVRNPSTGDMIESKDKWDKHDCYYQSPKSALRYIASQLCLEKSEYNSLKEYVETYESYLREMLKNIP